MARKSPNHGYTTNSFMETTSNRIDYSIDVGIIEAKNLKIDSEADLYAVVKVNNNQKAQTKKIDNTVEPFWNHTESILLDSTFRTITCVIYQNRIKKADALIRNPLRSKVGCLSAVGSVTFPASSLMEYSNTYEDWFILKSLVETDIIGSLDVRSRLEPSKITPGFQNLVLFLQSAENLICPLANPNMTVDAFAVLCPIPFESDQEFKRTSVFEKQISPHFQQTFEYELSDSVEAIYITCWDDANGKSKFLGEVCIPVDDFRKIGLSNTLNKHALSSTPYPKEVQKNKLIKRAKEHDFSLPGKVGDRCCVCLEYGDILMCKNCGDIVHEECVEHKKEACVYIMTKKPRQKRDDEISIDPKIESHMLYYQDYYIQNFRQSLESPQDINHQFQQSTSWGGYCFSCSKNIPSASKCLKCKICGDSIHNDDNCKENYSMVCGSVGKVRMKFTYKEERILELATYQRMFESFFPEDMYLLKCMNAVTKNREEVSKALVNASYSQGRLNEILRGLVKIDLKNLLDLNTMFRSNSLATKSYDNFLKTFGQSYLVELLQPIIVEVLASSDTRNCELDPLRLKKGEKAENNTANLTYFVDKILSKIRDSLPQVPLCMRRIFYELRDEVMPTIIKLGATNKSAIAYSCISAFLFLRFICPAILNPQLFGLMEGIPADNTKRNLTLIAKTLQTIANLSVYGDKEPYMKAMNPYILGQRDAFKAYIDDICTIPEYNEVAATQIITPISIDGAKELSRLYRYLTKIRDVMVEYLGDDVNANTAQRQSIEVLLEILDGLYFKHESIRAHEVTGQNTDTSGDVLINSEKKFSREARKSTVQRRGTVNINPQLFPKKSTSLTQVCILPKNAQKVNTDHRHNMSLTITAESISTDELESEDPSPIIKSTSLISFEDFLNDSNDVVNDNNSNHQKNSNSKSDSNQCKKSKNNSKAKYSRKLSPGPVGRCPNSLGRSSVGDLKFDPIVRFSSSEIDNETTSYLKSNNGSGINPDSTSNNYSINDCDSSNNNNNNNNNNSTDSINGDIINSSYNNNDKMNDINNYYNNSDYNNTNNNNTNNNNDINDNDNDNNNINNNDNNDNNNNSSENKSNTNNNNNNINNNNVNINNTKDSKEIDLKKVKKRKSFDNFFRPSSKKNNNIDNNNSNDNTPLISPKLVGPKSMNDISVSEQRHLGMSRNATASFTVQQEKMTTDRSSLPYISRPTAISPIVQSSSFPSPTTSPLTSTAISTSSPGTGPTAAKSTKRPPLLRMFKSKSETSLSTMTVGGKNNKNNNCNDDKNVDENTSQHSNDIGYIEKDNTSSDDNNKISNNSKYDNNYNITDRRQSSNWKPVPQIPLPEIRAQNIFMIKEEKVDNKPVTRASLSALSSQSLPQTPPQTPPKPPPKPIIVSMTSAPTRTAPQTELPKIPPSPETPQTPLKNLHLAQLAQVHHARKDSRPMSAIKTSGDISIEEEDDPIPISTVTFHIATYLRGTKKEDASKSNNRLSLNDISLVMADKIKRKQVKSYLRASFIPEIVNEDSEDPLDSFSLKEFKTEAVQIEKKETRSLEDSANNEEIGESNVTNPFSTLEAETDDNSQPPIDEIVDKPCSNVEVTKQPDPKAKKISRVFCEDINEEHYFDNVLRDPVITSQQLYLLKIKYLKDREILQPTVKE